MIGAPEGHGKEGSGGAPAIAAPSKYCRDRRVEHPSTLTCHPAGVVLSTECSCAVHPPVPPRGPLAGSRFRARWRGARVRVGGARHNRGEGSGDRERAHRGGRLQRRFLQGVLRPGEVAPSRHGAETRGERGVEETDGGLGRMRVILGLAGNYVCFCSCSVDDHSSLGDPELSCAYCWRLGYFFTEAFLSSSERLLGWRNSRAPSHRIVELMEHSKVGGDGGGGVPSTKLLVT